MDCNYWSCFVHENERLFIGGLTHLQINTIRNIPLSENYCQYIKVINILKHVVEGMGLLGIKPSESDVSCLDSLFNCELSVDGDSVIPGYIQTLFHHFVTKQAQFSINPTYLNTHFGYHSKTFNEDAYGYKKFQRIFMEKGVINFFLFIQLMPNLKVFTVLDVRGSENGAKAFPSIDLNETFYDLVSLCVDCLSSSFSSLSFSRFEIVKPKTSINQFVQQYQNEFLTKGWNVTNSTFGKQEYGIYGVEMLLIEKLTT